MEIALFSDTHGFHSMVSLPTCDIAIFAGDMSGRGSQREVESFFNWFSEQEQCEHKIVIAGNHDLSFDPNKNSPKGYPAWVDELETDFPEITYLENSDITINGLKIWGSPITPDFFPDTWAFNVPRGDKIESIWDKIPDGTDIVVTHGPAFGHHDRVPSGQYVGCEDLRRRLIHIKPKLHVCGHIHDCHGIKESQETIYVNASICTERYIPSNKPIVISL
jgi:Icc-related predicted phosphoesterase